MQNVKRLVTVERERERATLLNKVAHINVALKNIYFRKKDPCYGLRLLYLRI